MTAAVAAAPACIQARLSVLFFLQYFVWGAWYLTGFRYMIAHEMSYHAFWLYTASPLGAILAPFFLGLCVDRFFNAEKVLAVCFILGGVIMWCLPWIGDLPGTAVLQAGATPGSTEVAYYALTLGGFTMPKSSWFNLGIFAHMLCYMPTLALTAALAFRHLPNGTQRFPLVRLWGTLGWIAGGLVLGLGFTTVVAGRTAEAGEGAIQFRLAALASLAVGLFCLSLPRTPPPRLGQPFAWRDLFFLDAWQEWRNRAFATYLICAFLICIPLSAYYVYLSSQMGAMNQSHASVWGNVGTWLEAGMLFLMPLLIRRLGIKRMIAIGILAWVVRYALFSWSAGAGSVPAPFLADHSANPDYPGVVLAGFPIPFIHLGFLVFMLGVALHGISYDFFFITGQVYVDTVTPPEIRGQAQAMNLFFTYGLGLYVGAIVAGTLATHAFCDATGAAVVASSAAALPDWPRLWLPLAGFAALVLVVFVLAFSTRDAPQRR
ncbi:MAG: MFS transporter [Planctomycetes bacterium]|nr:MFS transporter [Planctomycetota bacterium]